MSIILLIIGRENETITIALAHGLMLQNGSVKCRSHMPHKAPLSGKETNTRRVHTAFVKHSIRNLRKFCLKFTVQQVWLSAVITTGPNYRQQSQ